jgi:hypothetical protein
MIWKKDKRKLLLSCESDSDLLKNFPDYTIESLRRQQRRFAPAKKNIGEIVLSVLIPDVHHPFHDICSWRAVLKFIAWAIPNRIVLMGDALEMRAIDHWKQEKGNLRSFEGVRLLHDYKEFMKDILVPLEEATPKAEHIYMGGNHEDWAYQLVDKIPQLEGMIEPELAMKLKERGWQWIPYIAKDRDGNYRKGTYKIGKLTLAHGFSTRKYHAAATTETYEKSVAYAHSHDVQLYTKVHAEDPSDYHTAQSIGCICNKAPQYLHGRPNRWVHAFGILYTQEDGTYNLYVPIIINGKFCFAGKIFDGND